MCTHNPLQTVSTFSFVFFFTGGIIFTIRFDCFSWTRRIGKRVCYYKRIEYCIRFKFDLMIFTLSMNYLIFFGFVTDNNNRTSTQFWYVHRCTFTVQTTSYCHPNNREQQRSPVMLHTSSIFYIYDYSFSFLSGFSARITNFSNPSQFLSSLSCYYYYYYYYRSLSVVSFRARHKRAMLRPHVGIASE